MNTKKNLLIVLGEWWEERQANRSEHRRNLWNDWLPSRGNVLFTLVMIAVLLWAQSAGAVPFRAESAASTGTIAYQGRLADSSGNALTGRFRMEFRLYNVSSGGIAVWTEEWKSTNEVIVSDGLFNVMLGSLTPIPQSVITGNPSLFLGISVGNDDEMSPRVQLGSVPFAVQALSVPDGSITGNKIANGTITADKLAGSVGGKPMMTAYTGQYSTNSTNWADIDSTNLSLTINSQANQTWLIISTIPGTSLTSGAPGWADFDIAIDGVRVSNADGGLAVAESSINYQGASVTMAWVATLSAGNHTIRPQWRGQTSGDSPQTMTATFTIIAVPF